MYGLVLGGGGAKGAYQIGVWKAINELELEIGYVCGTSVGALNGAFFAQKKYDIAYQMWSELGMDHVFNADKETIEGIDKIANEGVFATTFHFVKHTVKKIWDDSGLDISPLRSMISEYLDEDEVRNSDIGFGFVTISVNDKKALRLNVEDIDQGELKYYLLGSAMIPGFTQDESFDKKFIDGGLYDNFPLKMAYDKGYKKIIGVNLFTNKIKPKYKDADVIGIGPSKSLGNILYFNKDNAAENMKLGYLDAMKVFGELKGKEYYFNNVPKELELSQNLYNMDLEDKNNLSNLILKKELKNEKMFYEKVLYKLGKDFEMDTNGSYQDMYILALEKLMSKEKMEELEEYDFREIARNIDEQKGNRIMKAANILIRTLK
jgi:NTE family protein